MTEFIVIVEALADARIATKLAERVLLERIAWLEPEHVVGVWQWSGLLEGTEHCCWRDVKAVIDDSVRTLGYRSPRFLGHDHGQPFRADGAASMKILKLIRFLQKRRPIRAVLFIRDLDNQPARRQGIEQARSQYAHIQSELEIVIGTADRMREAWVLNGYVPRGMDEKDSLERVSDKLSFDPCTEPERLRSNSTMGSERLRNPKVLLDFLTESSKDREKECWEETGLAILRSRGDTSGLADYLDEIDERLVPIIG